MMELKDGLGFQVPQTARLAAAKGNMDDSLGFHWRPPQFPPDGPNSVDRAVFRYRQMLATFVHDASALEGNPFTWVEVKTLLDGVTVGGRRITDERQVLNLADAAKDLFAMVRTGQFQLNRETSNRIHKQVAREEALEWGHFRGEGKESTLTPEVALGRNRSHTPPATKPGAPNLIEMFTGGIEFLESDIADPRERAMAYFLFGALRQFYFDGNKRTARFMMNGVLMSNGFDAISVPAARAQEFNREMVDFYTGRDGTRMMELLIDCRPRDRKPAKVGPSGDI